ncbi:MAG: hypothetical protein K1X79_13770 [Oligoflexia bacterium]|nr:hypothetical protein [Oligoflexia bacterium]
MVIEFEAGPLVAVGVGLAVGPAEVGVADGVSVGVGELIGVAVGDLVGVTLRVGVAVGEALGIGLRVGVGLGDGLGVAERAALGVNVAVAVGVAIGVPVGLAVIVGVGPAGEPVPIMRFLISVNSELPSALAKKLPYATEKIDPALLLERGSLPKYMRADF